MKLKMKFNFVRRTLAAQIVGCQLPGERPELYLRLPTALGA